MTTRRWLLLLAMLTVAVVMGFGAWLLCPRTGITEENYARLRVGMTEQEVVGIIGLPAGDYRTERSGHPVGGIGPLGGFGHANEAVERKEWYGDFNWIQVAFDGDERVVAGFCGVTPGAVQVESLQARVRRWLRL